MTLHWVDYGWIILYLLALLTVGFIVARSRKPDTIEDFLLAGRSLTLPLFVATLVATWYGAILGVGEFIYQAGIVEWFAFALPYYLAALLYAYFLAIPIRQTSARTIPEQIRLHYGPTAALISAILIVILTLPVSYTLSFGILIELFGDLPRWIAIVIGTIFSVGYLLTGGFRATVLTDLLQFVLMYLGFLCLAIFTIIHFGPPDQMWNQLPLTHTQLPGPYSWQFLAVWYIIALQTLVDPGFHQRCAAVRNPTIARRGITLAVVFWFIFDMLTLTCGLYARAYLPTLSDPLLSFPLLADTVLPPMLKGLFLVALLATIMSTLDSYGFLSATTLSYDIVFPLSQRWKRPIASVTAMRLAIALVATASIIFALLLPSIVQLIYYSASIAVSGLLFPLVISYHPSWRISAAAARHTMIAGAVTTTGWILARLSTDIPILHGIEPMLVGLGSATVCLLIHWIINQQRAIQ